MTTIESDIFESGDALSTVAGYEYRHCSVVCRRSPDGVISLYCRQADWSFTPAGIAAQYETQVAGLQAEVEQLKAQLAAQAWQPLPAPPPAQNLDCPECAYVGKNSRDLGRHRWQAHGTPGSSVKAIRDRGGMQ